MAQKSRADILAEINAQLPNNNQRYITAAKLRGVLIDISDSDLNLTDDISLEGLHYGQAVTSGHNTEVLYIDGSGNLSSDSNFNRNSSAGFATAIQTDMAGGVGSYFNLGNGGGGNLVGYNPPYTSQLGIQAGATTSFAVFDNSHTLLSPNVAVQLSDNSGIYGLKFVNNGISWLWPTTDSVGVLTSDGSGNLSFAGITGTDTHVPYFDATTGVLTDDVFFTRDNSANYATSITAINGSVQCGINITDGSLQLGITDSGATYSTNLNLDPSHTQLDYYNLSGTIQTNLQLDGTKAILEYNNFTSGLSTGISAGSLELKLFINDGTTQTNFYWPTEDGTAGQALTTTGGGNLYWSDIAGGGGSGFSGFSGATGVSGYSGKSGFSGVNGSAGTSGFSGVSGFSGASGFSGLLSAGTPTQIPYFDATTGDPIYDGGFTRDSSGNLRTLIQTNPGFTSYSTVDIEPAQTTINVVDPAFTAGTSWLAAGITSIFTDISTGTTSSSILDVNQNNQVLTDGSTFVAQSVLNAASLAVQLQDLVNNRNGALSMSSTSTIINSQDGTNSLLSEIDLQQTNTNISWSDGINNLAAQLSLANGSSQLSYHNNTNTYGAVVELSDNNGRFEFRNNTSGINSGLLATDQSAVIGITNNTGNNTTLEVNDVTQTYTLNKLGGSGSGYVVVDNSGVLSWSAGGSSGGTYTPTTTNTTNISGAGIEQCLYTRVDNIVTVTGRVEIITSSTGTTVLTISLPVASTLVSATDLFGTGTATSATAAFIHLDGNVAAGQADLTFESTVGTSDVNVYFTFSYIVQ